MPLSLTKSTHVIGDFVQSRATRANRQDGAGLAKHERRLAYARARSRVSDKLESSGQNKSARRAASAF